MIDDKIKELAKDCAEDLYESIQCWHTGEGLLRREQTGIEVVDVLIKLTRKAMAMQCEEIKDMIYHSDARIEGHPELYEKVANIAKQLRGEK